MPYATPGVYVVPRDFPDPFAAVPPAPPPLPAEQAADGTVVAPSVIAAVEAYLGALLRQCVFAANTDELWAKLTEHASAYLAGYVAAGQLGSFTVECGLGSSMTAEDVVDGALLLTIVLTPRAPGQPVTLTLRETMSNAA